MLLSACNCLNLMRIKENLINIRMREIWFLLAFSVLAAVSLFHSSPERRPRLPQSVNIKSSTLKSKPTGQSVEPRKMACFSQLSWSNLMSNPCFWSSYRVQCKSSGPRDSPTTLRRKGDTRSRPKMEASSWPSRICLIRRGR